MGNKWLAEVLSSQVLEANPYLVPDLVHLQCVGEILGIYERGSALVALLDFPGTARSLAFHRLPLFRNRGSVASVGSASARRSGSNAPLQHFTILRDRRTVRIIHACCHGLATVASLAQKFTV